MRKLQMPTVLVLANDLQQGRVRQTVGGTGGICGKGLVFCFVGFF